MVTLKSRSGATAVEFAIVLPIIILLLASSLEIGHAFNILSALQNAAREGARHSVVSTATTNSVTEICQQSLTTCGITNPVVSVSPDPANAESGTMIRVTVTASYAENSLMSLSKYFNDRHLSASVAMRKE